MLHPGSLLLAEEKGGYVGCVGVRQFSDFASAKSSDCMCIPAARGRGVGGLLAKGIVLRPAAWIHPPASGYTTFHEEAHSLYVVSGFQADCGVSMQPCPRTAFLELTSMNRKRLTLASGEADQRVLLCWRGGQRPLMPGARRQWRQVVPQCVTADRRAGVGVIIAAGSKSVLSPLACTRARSWCNGRRYPMLGTRPFAVSIFLSWRDSSVPRWIRSPFPLQWLQLSDRPASMGRDHSAPKILTAFPRWWSGLRWIHSLFISVGRVRLWILRAYTGSSHSV